MAYNEHPIKEDARRFYGERLDEKTNRWFIRQDAHTRQGYIRQLESVVSAQDGVTLRKKATLMRDVQRLAQIDRNLRNVGR
jgi:hypothetical protein